jgi:hypothetical protein
MPNYSLFQSVNEIQVVKNELVISRDYSLFFIYFRHSYFSEYFRYWLFTEVCSGRLNWNVLCLRLIEMILVGWIDCPFLSNYFNLGLLIIISYWVLLITLVIGMFPLLIFEIALFGIVSFVKSYAFVIREVVVGETASWLMNLFLLFVQ